ncbi:hypothetical protein N8I71_02125 [Roseibacterium sp. SDUM158016]|uniref:DUF6782 family putative metallopeptidase n=1 Tax=Roseicyclus sediminis TaxID=2980997 RepID=UPI0021CF32CB|nr:DUF6782 family putative metallopeptidase [Roseibacterium sp. SDUM158016]MCU4651609.1 hypothetical protein [Roseibacterium sp. SDUM158016]
MSRWSDFKTAVASFALAVWFAVPAQAGDEVCANPPDYRSGDAALDALLQRVTPALEEYPSLRDAVSGIAPAFCISGEPFNALGFYEPETRKIVVSEGLDPDLQLAILFHELRHVEHHARGLCPDLSLSMRDYARAVWAMEADAATISLIVAWDYAEGGDPGPWDALVDQPRFGDIARTFGAVVSEGGDIFTASEAAFTAWYQNEDRRTGYYIASCLSYLDDQEQSHALPAYGSLPPAYFDRLCILPDGRPFDCEEPASSDD